MYKYKFTHRPAREMRHVDALSRLPLPEPTGIEDESIHRLFDDCPLDFEKIREEQKRDPLVRKLFACVHHGWPVKVPNCVLPYYKIRSSFSVEDCALFYCDRIVIPESMKNNVLEIVHEPHCGIVRMKMNARSYVWWKNVNDDIEKFVASCPTCQQTQNSKCSNDTVEWPKSARPFERIHLDFFHFEKRTCLVIVDSYSKFIDVKEMNKTNAACLIGKMREVFAYFGLPDQIVSDNGPPFGSKQFVEFGKQNGIKMTRIPPYHPESNGLAERAVQTVKSVFKKAFLDIKTITMPELISKFVITYNNTPSTAISKTPNDLIYSFKPRTLLSTLNPKQKEKKVNEKYCEQKIQYKQQANKTKKEEEFKVNEKIMFRNVFKNYVKWIPGRVVKKVSFCTYLVNVNDNIKYVHRTQIRRSSLDDKFHPDYLIRGNIVASNEQPNQTIETKKKRKRSSEGKLSSPKKIRRSKRIKRAPLRFDFRNYMKY